MRVAFLLVLAALVAVAGWLVLSRPYRAGSLAWRAVERDVAARYPEVPTVSTAALAARLEAPVLLDARTPAEYAVSHLPGARRVDPDATAAELADALGGLGRDREVVVYCSVGVRSAQVAERLRTAGFERVANLEGSIFRWANEGRPLVRGGAPASTVHPYDAVWGRLLRPEARAALDAD